MNEDDEPASPEETLFLTPGTVLRDRYRVEELVGEGGMATVFRAWDLELSESVALKVFLSVVANASLLRRFRREMKINRRLNHPNIVRTHEFGTWRGARYITMELLQGQELWEYVRDHRPGPLQLLELLMQVCDGLGHAHEAGIVHRDLKPSNLFVTDGGRRLKLMDFGIAKATDSSQISVTGVRVGTPRYMSPEQIQTGGTIGVAADLYGVGAVMYETFAGRPVFEDSDLLPLLLNHLTEEPLPPSAHVPGLAPEIDVICLKLLQKDPADRYQSCAELRQALEHAHEMVRRRLGG